MGHSGAVTAGVPRRFIYEVAGRRPRSARLFDPEFTPALRTDLAIDERAGASAKMAQKAVEYQDTPKGDEECSNCSLFQLASMVSHLIELWSSRSTA
jgi:hypothetical protein